MTARQAGAVASAITVCLTQDALGLRLGMTEDQVEAVEVGGMLPLTADLLVRPATALQVTVDLHVVSDGPTTLVFEERAA